MDKLISSIVKTCLLQLRECRHIRSFILKSTSITLANALNILILLIIVIVFFMVYQSSLLIDYKKKQKSVARTVTCTSCSVHITPILKSLY